MRQLRGRNLNGLGFEIMAKDVGWRDAGTAKAGDLLPKDTPWLGWQFQVRHNRRLLGNECTPGARRVGTGSPLTLAKGPAGCKPTRSGAENEEPEANNQ